LTARRPEGGFGQAGLPAIIGNFLQQLLRVHARVSPVFPRVPAPSVRSHLNWIGAAFRSSLRAGALSKATNFVGVGQPQTSPPCQWDNIWAIALRHKRQKMQVFFGVKEAGCRCEYRKNGFCGQRPTSPAASGEKIRGDSATY
jgi:hypothetical protein